MNSEYDNICFVNSDHVFSKDWLTNLLKHHDGVNIPSPRLVESGRLGICYTHIIMKDFGISPDTIDKEGFRTFAEKIKIPSLWRRGAIMPIVLTKERIKESGGFNGYLGDVEFIERLERDYSMRHVTACDSIVYHVTMGETALEAPYMENSLLVKTENFGSTYD
jgi:hypothetical protein